MIKVQFTADAIAEVRKDTEIEKKIEDAVSKAFSNIDFSTIINNVYERELDKAIKGGIQDKIRKMLENVNITSFISNK